MSENIVLHNQEGNSDKIYIVCVRDKGSSAWEVVGKWGRRGKNVSEQSKGIFSTIGVARSEAITVAREKRAKGYVDIDSSEYDGPLKKSSPEVAKYLEGDVTRPETLPEPKKSKKPKMELEDGIPVMRGDQVCVAKCLNNEGMQEQFDIGVDYIITKTFGDEGIGMMVAAIDSNGVERDCYRIRFDSFRVE